MDNLWMEYERGSYRRWEFQQAHPEIQERTRLEEIYAWEDYAIKNYMRWIDIPHSASPVLEATVSQQHRRDLD